MQQTVFPCKQDVYQKTPPLNKSLHLILFLQTFMSEWQQTKICTQRAWKLVRLNVHLLAVARLLRRHGAAGCQSKDLYRAVAAAETDIGRHGMHDKSRWTGGTRLKKQKNTQVGRGGVCQSGSLLLCNLKNTSFSLFSCSETLTYKQLGVYWRKKTLYIFTSAYVFMQITQI